MGKRFTYWIIGGLILGAVVGYILNNAIADPKTAAIVAGYFSIVTDLFLRLIKMIIAPLVISMLIVGIAHMGDTEAIGRIGLKALAWFFSASLVSLAFGLLMVNLLRPGDNLNLPLPEAGTATNLKVSALSLKEFVTHVVPRSIVEAMANNEILQIVVFSIFAGIAVTALGEKGKQIVIVADELAHVMLKITNYVMLTAPFAVFAAVAATVTTQGMSILLTYGKFMGEFYMCLALLWVILVLAGSIFIGPRTITLLRFIREPFLLAFSTSSSEAAYPKTVEQLERFGVSNRIVSFVLPLGYSFNLDGTMMYCTFATMFIAQAYAIDLPLSTQLAMLLLLMLTSKGMAGVPRASLVVIAATLSTFNVPEAGLLLIMGIDQFLDMGRSATNVVGNSIATVVVGKWEGEYDPTHVHEAMEEEPVPAVAAQ
ncbi:MAG TPA: dicarboxylate/amino acid:cation symporter [Xanthobacteraceae bacterium]|nr:dicarboxylate/amino acid:cation symporter [Xanthobacteraceae bacterium]